MQVARDRELHGKRVLVVEDEYLTASDIDRALHALGVVVLGPVASVRGAVDLLGLERVVDVALLDIDLNGETSFPVADALMRLGIPFLFVSGYDGRQLPSRFAAVRRCGKPIAFDDMIDAVAGAMRERS